jgi:hypothetical protein
LTGKVHGHTGNPKYADRAGMHGQYSAADQSYSSPSSQLMEGVVPLTNCPECGHQVSTAAEACPNCGHPMRVAPQAQSGPKCYCCSAPATTRCQSCGALSCAQHLQSIYVSHGRGGAYELRCQSCYSSALAWKVFGWIIGGIVLIIVLFWIASRGVFR